MANALKQKEIARILEPKLIEEKETDIVLTRIEESGINEEAGREVFTDV